MDDADHLFSYRNHLKTYIPLFSYRNHLKTYIPIIYNGQAASGASLIINKDNLDDYLIEYDKTNKVVKIISRK